MATLGAGGRSKRKGRRKYLACKSYTNVPSWTRSGTGRAEHESQVNLMPQSLYTLGLPLGGRGNLRSWKMKGNIVCHHSRDSWFLSFLLSIRTNFRRPHQRPSGTQGGLKEGRKATAVSTGPPDRSGLLTSRLLYVRKDKTAIFSLSLSTAGSILNQYGHPGKDFNKIVMMTTDKSLGKWPT